MPERRLSCKCEPYAGCGAQRLRIGNRLLSRNLAARFDVMTGSCMQPWFHQDERTCRWHMSEKGTSAKPSAYLVLMREYNRIANAEPEEKRLAFAEFALLVHLGAVSRPVLSSELACCRVVSAAATSTAVTRMAGLGYAWRRRHPGDARKREVCMTRSGEGHVARMILELSRSLSCGADATRPTTQDLLLAVDEMGSACHSGGDLLPLASLGTRAETMTAAEIGESLMWSKCLVDDSVGKALRMRWIASRSSDEARAYALTANGESRARKTAERVLADSKHIDGSLVAKEPQGGVGGDAVSRGGLSEASAEEGAKAAPGNKSHDGALPDGDEPPLRGNHSLGADERQWLCDLVGRSVLQVVCVRRRGHCERIELIGFNDRLWPIVLQEEKLDLGRERPGASVASLLRVCAEDKRHDGWSGDDSTSIGVFSTVKFIDVIDYMVAYTFRGQLQSAFAYTQSLVLHLMNGSAAVIDRGPWAEAELSMTVADEPVDVLHMVVGDWRGQMADESAANCEVHLNRVITSIYPKRCTQQVYRF